MSGTTAWQPRPQGAAADIRWSLKPPPSLGGQPLWPQYRQEEQATSAAESTTHISPVPLVPAPKESTSETWKSTLGDDRQLRVPKYPRPIGAGPERVSVPKPPPPVPAKQLPHEVRQTDTSKAGAEGKSRPWHTYGIDETGDYREWSRYQGMPDSDDGYAPRAGASSTGHTDTEGGKPEDDTSRNAESWKAPYPENDSETWKRRGYDTDYDPRKDYQ